MNATSLPHEIRGVVLPVTGGRVLVPSTTMAEVITFAPPEPVLHAPGWLLGRVGWRGWRLPVLAFSVLAGVSAHEATDNTRVAVLKALNGYARLPYLGVLTQGFPRLTLVFRDSLVADSVGEMLPTGVREQVRVQDEPAWIPDLELIEQELVDVLARAA